MAKLVFMESDSRVCELAEGVTRVGRSDDNHIIIRDATVSGHHCQILVHGTEVIVREAGSRNGTWVQGVAVTGQMPVKSGQSIRFGGVSVRLELDPLPLSDRGTPETAVLELLPILAEQRRAAKNPKPAVTAFTVEPRPLAGTTDPARPDPGTTPSALPDPAPSAGKAEARPADPLLRRWRRWLSGLFVVALLLGGPRASPPAAAPLGHNASTSLTGGRTRAAAGEDARGPTHKKMNPELDMAPPTRFWQHARNSGQSHECGDSRHSQLRHRGAARRRHRRGSDG